MQHSPKSSSVSGGRDLGGGLLNPNYRAIGIGRATNAGLAYHWYWTTDFGGYVDETSGCSTVNPGGSCTITVTFSPLTTGGKSANLNIYSNDPLRSSVQVYPRGSGM